jgi:WhiB family redox-sensing transcriptional regulator
MADYSRLPGPNADLWDWQLRGLCRGKDSSLFFHPEGERGAARAAREQSAKEICLNCPVQKQCSEHALRVREPYGVWGGMTEEERETHYQRQKALVRARAARERAALAEKGKLKEKLLRDRERELARLAKEREAAQHARDEEFAAVTAAHPGPDADAAAESALDPAAAYAADLADTAAADAAAAAAAGGAGAAGAAAGGAAAAASAGAANAAGEGPLELAEVKRPVPQVATPKRPAAKPAAVKKLPSGADPGPAKKRTPAKV